MEEEGRGGEAGQAHCIFSQNERAAQRSGPPFGGARRIISPGRPRTYRFQGRTLTYLFPRQALQGPRQHLLRQPRLHGEQQAQHLAGYGGVRGVDAWKEAHAGLNLSRYCQSPASARTVVYARTCDEVTDAVPVTIVVYARTCDEVRLAADAIPVTIVVLVGLVGRSSPQ